MNPLQNPQMLFPLAVVVFGGVAVAIQAPINARLGSAIGGPLLAAFISFAVGLLALLVVIVLSSEFPSIGDFRNAAAWTFSGGVFGAFFIFAITFALLKLGSATTISATIFGQLLAALVIDRLGFFGLERIEISPYRLLGVVLIFAGVVLTQTR